MRITDPKAITCCRFPGSVHTTGEGAYATYHVKLGNGCWGQYPAQYYESAYLLAEQESLNCRAAGYGVTDHGHDFAHLKGFVSWAWDPKERTTGGFALFVCSTKAGALEEAKAYYENTLRKP